MTLGSASIPACSGAGGQGFPPECLADCGCSITPDDDVSALCGGTGGAFEFEGFTYCKDCFLELVEEMPVVELAHLLGARFITWEEMREKRGDSGYG